MPALVAEHGLRSVTMSQIAALIHHEHHGTELAELLHRGAHVARAQQDLSDLALPVEPVKDDKSSDAHQRPRVADELA